MALCLLFDQCLSSRLAETLSRAGMDAFHVRDHGLLHTPDEAIFARAHEEGWMIVTADADFTRLAVASGEPRPSIIHLRMAQPYDLPDVAERLRLLCNVFRDELESGAILAVGDTTERIRKLPLA